MSHIEFEADHPEADKNCKKVFEPLVRNTMVSFGKPLVAALWTEGSHQSHPIILIESASAEKASLPSSLTSVCYKKFITSRLRLVN